MSDIIKILPTEVLNKIAAGEVVQRPASVVKELMENSIDAKSTKIKLIVRDSGKTLIQVVDNGEGMSKNDMKMSFMKHATSKITKIEDIFSITSMGFRGEALASISSISNIEMISKKKDADKTNWVEEPDTGGGGDLDTQIAKAEKEYKSASQASMGMGQNTSTNNPGYDIAALDAFKKLKALKAKKAGKKESITIDGQKYRPIKDSVEPKKHILRETYERIGGK